MEIPRALANVIQYAGTISTQQQDTISTLKAVVVTPVNQIELLLPSGFAAFSLFALNCADEFLINAQLQPGVYLDEVLPYKDNLFIEVTVRKGLKQTMTRYRATPKGDVNPQMTGNSVKLADMKAKDFLNMVSVKFHLMEPGYAVIKNTFISDKHLMTDLASVLHYQLLKYGNQLQLTGPDAFKGVDIELPIDNDRIFAVIDISPPIPLQRLGRYLQDHPEFGIYTRGFGMYYRKGLWRIYPMFKNGRYEKAKRVLNVYRVPQDIVPSLETTYFQEGNVLTILSTGVAKQIDGKDIVKQNKGTGKRIISADSLMGETGAYYAKGQALATRADTLSEYRTSSRGSGEQSSPFVLEPTGNLAKYLSENSFNDGTLETIQWMNSDHSLLDPAMPVRFFYMVGDVLKYKEGTLLAARTESVKDKENPKELTFRQSSAMSMFLNNDEFLVE